MNTESFCNLIGDQCEAGDATMDVRNPATGEIFAQAPKADEAQLNAAVTAATRAGTSSGRFCRSSSIVITTSESTNENPAHMALC